MEGEKFVQRVRLHSREIMKDMNGISMSSYLTQNKMEIDSWGLTTDLKQKILMPLFRDVKYILSYDVIIAHSMVLRCFHNFDILGKIGCIVNGCEISCTVSESFMAFHIFVLRMDLLNEEDIKSFNDHPLVKYIDSLQDGDVKFRKGMKQIAYLITDIGSDPHDDDIQAVIVCEKLRYLFELWADMRYVIMAKGAYGDRLLQLQKVLTNMDIAGYTIYIYDTETYEVDQYDGKAYRFYSPVGFTLVAETVPKLHSFYEIFNSNERTEIDTISCIGQMGLRFSFEMRLFFMHTKVEVVMLQGPGFNTVGILDPVEHFRSMAKSFFYSDKSGAARVSMENRKLVLQGMKKYLPNIEDLEVQKIFQFFITNGGRAYFESMFHGAKYEKIVPEMFQTLEKYGSLHHTVDQN